MAAIDPALVHLRQEVGSNLLQPEPFNQLARPLGHVFRETVLTPENTLRLFVQQIAHSDDSELEYWISVKRK